MIYECYDNESLVKLIILPIVILDGNLNTNVVYVW